MDALVTMVVCVQELSPSCTWLPQVVQVELCRRVAVLLRLVV